VLPAIRGQVQTGLRVGLGIAWVVLVPAEMLGVRSGLGYQILNARDQLAYDQVMAVIVVIGVLGFCLDWGARHLLRERRRPVRVEDSDSATSL
jgi:NitT/TauT family transport system permease protein